MEKSHWSLILPLFWLLMLASTGLTYALRQADGEKGRLEQSKYHFFGCMPLRRDVARPMQGEWADTPGAYCCWSSTRDRLLILPNALPLIATRIVAHIASPAYYMRADWFYVGMTLFMWLQWWLIGAALDRRAAH